MFIIPPYRLHPSHTGRKIVVTNDDAQTFVHLCDRCGWFGPINTAPKGIWPIDCPLCRHHSRLMDEYDVAHLDTSYEAMFRHDEERP